MKRLIVILPLILLTGCVGIVDYAKDYFKDMQDTNRYEEVRDLQSLLCDTDKYNMFVDRFGKEVVDKWVTEICNPVTRTTD